MLLIDDDDTDGGHDHNDDDGESDDDKWRWWVIVNMTIFTMTMIQGLRKGFSPPPPPPPLRLGNLVPKVLFSPENLYERTHSKRRYAH